MAGEGGFHRDRQTDRQSERERERETDRQTDRDTETQRETDRDRESETVSQSERQRHTESERAAQALASSYPASTKRHTIIPNQPWVTGSNTSVITGTHTHLAVNNLQSATSSSPTANAKTITRDGLAGK